MSADRLTALECLARETGNPAFAWEALAGCDAAEDLPAWVFKYLRESAIRLIAVDAHPHDIPSGILEALLLSGPGGPGKLKQAETARKKRTALDYMTDQVSTVGVNDAAALAAAKFGFKAGTLRTYFYQNKRGAE